ncbi:zinc finger protein 22-like [Wyeomyia smithii]|uniref:zinc finger protein 22-like n=1 Tax=Wyeomyia smithii TaxID=174621 RepID=UPI002467F4F0|nr:zinc finger protein 22-like [Wyeomyia smithii]
MSVNHKIKASTSTNNILSANLTTVCRTCLVDEADSDTELYRIKEIYIEEESTNTQVQSFEEMLCLFVDDEIGRDSSNIPNSICMACIEKTRTAFHFFEMCRRTDVTLRECLLRNDESIKVEENKQGTDSTDDTEKYTLEVVVVDETVTESHKKISEKTIKRNVCEICCKSFSQPQTLNRHKKIHTKDSQPGKPCEYCKRLFLRSDDLRRHIRTHTNERPYACDTCPKAFKQSNELKDHKTSAHSESGQRRQFSCTICGKQLGTRNGWYVHMKVHRGEKNHNCLFCKKRFVTSGELTSHLKHIHTFEVNAEVLQCRIDGCIKNFVTKSALRFHQSKKHNV